MAFTPRRRDEHAVTAVEAYDPVATLTAKASLPPQYTAWEWRTNGRTAAGGSIARVRYFDGIRLLF